MKEPVRKTKHPYMAAVAIVIIAGVYFYLMANSRYPAPGPNLLYDVETYASVDQVETRFEETGRIDPGLDAPRAMAVGPEGRIYVAGKGAVAVFDEDGAEVSRFEVKGNPTAMALAPDGAILLGIGDHVEVVDLQGVVAAVWDSPGKKAYITSIVADEQDVFIADAGNRVVYRYNRQGILQGRIGEADEDRDIPGIVVPSPYFDVAFDDEGTLWVVNPGRMGLESYRPNGDLITWWYKPSLELEGFSGCCNPSHIAFDADGRLIAVDKGLVRVKAYEVTAGRFEELIAGSKLFPKEQAVKDLAVDSRNRILVLDPREDVIRIFEVKEDADEKISQSA